MPPLAPVAVARIAVILRSRAHNYVKKILGYWWLNRNSTLAYHRTRLCAGVDLHVHNVRKTHAELILTIDAFRFLCASRWLSSGYPDWLSRALCSLCRTWPSQYGPCHSRPSRHAWSRLGSRLLVPSA